MAALGASGQLLEDSVTYGRIILAAIPAYILQYEFQCLFSTAEKPALGLYVTIAAGFTNMILDALFVAVFSFGLEGAAAATAISQCVGGIIPLIYFARPNRSLLRLGKTAFDEGALAKTCINGSSELMSNISMSVVSMLYNAQLLKYAGEDGVAAYGAGNHPELKNLLKKSLVLIDVFAVIMFVSAFAQARPLSLIFVSYDEELLNMTIHAFSIFSFSFLFSGYAIYASSFFTALGDGLTSAAISFLRTLVFQIAAVLILPLFFKLNGIWLSIVVAEVMALIVAVLFLRVKQK